MQQGSESSHPVRSLKMCEEGAMNKGRAGLLCCLYLFPLPVTSQGTGYYNLGTMHPTP